jgi:hypothetical protein
MDKLMTIMLRRKSKKKKRNPKNQRKEIKDN